MTVPCRFRPENPNHAIVEMAVVIRFVPMASQHITALKAIRADLKDDLPRYEPLAGFGIVMKQGVPTPSQMSEGTGMRLSRMRSDGRRSALVHIDPDAIGVHYMEYTSWGNASDIVLGYLERIFAHLTDAHLQPISIGLMYLDRFLHEPESGEYDLSTLMRRESPLLHSRAFNSGPVWHSHSGWFEQLPSHSTPALHQLNVDSGRALVDGEECNVVTIGHTVTVANDDPAALLSYMPISILGKAKLATLLTAMHNLNKQVVGQLLTDDMQRMISL